MRVAWSASRRWWIVGGVAACLLLLGGWLTRPMFLAPAGEPLAQEAGPQPAVIGGPQRKVSVLFVGDTHFGESYSESSGRKLGDHRRYVRSLAGLSDLLYSADLVVANLETPLPQRRESPLRYLKRYVHWGHPEQTASALHRAGIRVTSLANNHAYDALGNGLFDTVAALRAAGIESIGAGATLQSAARPYRSELRLGQRRLRLAVIGAFQRSWGPFLTGAYATDSGGGTYPLTAETITGQIRALKQSDPRLFVVVFPHWGKNYAWRTAEQARLATAMLEAGADLIVGHGAHLFQEAELRGGRLVLYSLGNFVFLSPGRYSSYERMHPWSVAARLELAEQQGMLTLEMALYFILSDNLTTHYRPHLLNNADFERAADVLLEGGSLSTAARSELRRVARVDADAVGQHLRIPLGHFPR